MPIKNRIVLYNSSGKSAWHMFSPMSKSSAEHSAELRIRGKLFAVYRVKNCKVGCS